MAVSTAPKQLWSPDRVSCPKLKTSYWKHQSLIICALKIQDLIGYWNSQWPTSQRMQFANNYLLQYRRKYWNSLTRLFSNLHRYLCVILQITYLILHCKIWAWNIFHWAHLGVLVFINVAGWSPKPFLFLSYSTTASKAPYSTAIVYSYALLDTI